MSTPNFAYNNRCVVVSDDDCDCGYHPSLSDKINTDLYGRSHPSSEVLGEGEFRFFVIVITAGYYEHSCIDYVEREDFFDCVKDKEDFFSEFQYLAGDHKQTKKGLYKYLTECVCFKISRGKFNEIVAHKDLEESCYAVLDYLKDEEEKAVNRAIDKIREDYGYEEVRCKGVFSNGEAVYERVG